MHVCKDLPACGGPSTDLGLELFHGEQNFPRVEGEDVGIEGRHDPRREIRIRQEDGGTTAHHSYVGLVRNFTFE